MDVLRYQKQRQTPLCMVLPGCCDWLVLFCLSLDITTGLGEATSLCTAAGGRLAIL